MNYNSSGWYLQRFVKTNIKLMQLPKVVVLMNCFLTRVVGISRSLLNQINKHLKIPTICVGETLASNSLPLRHLCLKIIQIIDLLEICLGFYYLRWHLFWEIWQSSFQGEKNVDYVLLFFAMLCVAQLMEVFHELVSASINLALK